MMDLGKFELLQAVNESAFVLQELHRLMADGAVLCVD